ncbi:hypothetical protein NMT12_190027 [metagenome]
MISEEHSSHVCFSGKIIDYSFDTEFPNEVIVYDGQNSFFMPISFLRIIMKFHQPKGNTKKNNRQGNSTIFSVLFPLWDTFSRVSNRDIA